MRAPIISGVSSNVAYLGGKPPAPVASSEVAPFRVLRPDNTDGIVYCASPHGVSTDIGRTEHPPNRRSSPRRHGVEQRLSDGTWSPCGAIEHHSDGTTRYVPSTQ